LPTNNQNFIIKKNETSNNHCSNIERANEPISVEKQQNQLPLTNNNFINLIQMNESVLIDLDVKNEFLKKVKSNSNSDKNKEHNNNIEDIIEKEDAKKDYPKKIRKLGIKIQTPKLNKDLYEFNLYDEFSFFNKLFFDGKLDCVAVEWSKRMTLCAGTFQQKDGLPLIRLSEPLLKFRDIKDTKETLIHEMIHAWNYVESHDLSDDPSGHGMNFKKKMNEINQKSEYSITIYHHFNEEVDYHRKHIWKCDGICQTKPPYYGFVKRAMNRVPGPGDRWWNEHKIKCGGNFDKIAEPENYKNKKIKKVNKNSKKKIFDKNNDLKNYNPQEGNNNFKNIDNFLAKKEDSKIKIKKDKNEKNSPLKNNILNNKEKINNLL